MQRDGFVCAINGSRDGYQVPAALHEGGLLRRFVTDYYAPDDPPRWLPERLKRRHSPLLPSAAVSGTPSCFLAQNAADRLGLLMNRVFPHTDKLLARHALQQAKRLSANLYCYSSYLPDWRRIPHDMRVIDFEYHPLPGLTLDLLREDAARYGEVAWSWEQEQRLLQLERVNENWKHADAVVCASAMTARTLEHAGCDPAQITIIPYGFEASGTAPSRSPEGPAKFLFVGQGMQRKGLHHLLRAWRGIDPARARLTLVCYAIDPGIRELADQPGVQLLGRQDRTALDALMQGADVFVMPSLIEGFGLVYLEALAAGCYVIGTANTGLPDLPLSDAARTLVPVGDIAALGETIERLIARREAGLLDAPGIAAEAQAWTWPDFRARIAAHARTVL
jgi:glycosyltransferase involved in cell wall biosynthesis